MQNRQKYEMVRDILTSANGGATISQIMFKAYISHSQARQYLSMLVESGYVEFDAIDRNYRTTAQGLEYLAAIQNLSDTLQIKTRRAASTSGQDITF
jgi:predicted transcriptional regulator